MPAPHSGTQQEYTAVSGPVKRLAATCWALPVKMCGKVDGVWNWTHEEAALTPLTTLIVVKIPEMECYVFSIKLLITTSKIFNKIIETRRTIKWHFFSPLIFQRNKAMEFHICLPPLSLFFSFYFFVGSVFSREVVNLIKRYIILCYMYYNA